MFIISGDIGGTNSRFQAFFIRGELKKTALGHDAPGKLVFEKQYSNSEFESFESILNTFLKEAKLDCPPVTAALAVAGPVSDNSVVLTNRRWKIDGDELAKSTGMKEIKLINDFVSNGYGLLTLSDDDCKALNDVEATPNAPIACIGAGTGLGECFLTHNGNTYEAFPTEGGHAEFAPRTDLEYEMLDFLKNKFQEKHRVSVERVISGHGIFNIYEFLTTKFKEDVNEDLHSKVLASGDMHASIIAQEAAKPNGDKLCKQAMKIFVGAYGSEAGVAGLKWLPFGGLYIAGGIAPKNLGMIEDGTFMEAFHDKGRVAGILDNVPVKVVMREDIGQRGAHLVAYNLLLNHQHELEPHGITTRMFEPTLIASLCAACAATLWLFFKR
eukprot:TRINITY_DN8136_c0_g1_i1.p1 TRINITY_DN8136_c0_g1~~TRINITY_DN8136_c0_g1_i1.p1  ORF type:complete len:384 (+),score=79.32 TRINITY_DN8136_c0_g1_i1:128-1279(+)